MGSDRR